MMLPKRVSWFLIAFAVWNLYVWATFVWNVFPQHHFDSFFLVHAVIGAITSLLGLGVGLVGLRALRSSHAP